jgi:hypothetical protein
MSDMARSDGDPREPAFIAPSLEMKLSKVAAVKQ